MTRVRWTRHAALVPRDENETRRAIAAPRYAVMYGNVRYAHGSTPPGKLRPRSRPCPLTSLQARRQRRRGTNHAGAENDAPEFDFESTSHPSLARSHRRVDRTNEDEGRGNGGQSQNGGQHQHGAQAFVPLAVKPCSPTPVEPPGPGLLRRLVARAASDEQIRPDALLARCCEAVLSAIDPAGVRPGGMHDVALYQYLVDLYVVLIEHDICVPRVDLAQVRDLLIAHAPPRPATEPASSASHSGDIGPSRPAAQPAPELSRVQRLNLLAPLLVMLAGTPATETRRQRARDVVLTRYGAVRTRVR